MQVSMTSAWGEPREDSCGRYQGTLGLNGPCSGAEACQVRPHPAKVMPTERNRCRRTAIDDRGYFFSAPSRGLCEQFIARRDSAVVRAQQELGQLAEQISRSQPSNCAALSTSASRSFWGLTLFTRMPSDASLWTTLWRAPAVMEGRGVKDGGKSGPGTEIMAVAGM